MLIRLLSDGLFNLADPVLNFAGILFSPALGFQVGVLGKLADFLLDCSFGFAKLACCLIVRARFHHEFLLRRLLLDSRGPCVTPLFCRQVIAPAPVRRRVSDSGSSRFAGLRCWLRLCQAAMRRRAPTGSSLLPGDGQRKYPPPADRSQ